MANFIPAYDETLLSEGGYRLVDIPGDRGGQTYAGISRVMNPDWPGWTSIDAGQIPPTQAVRDFYRAGWWEPIHGDLITDQRVASSIFNFSVNTGLTVAIKLAQLAVGAAPDGDFGPKTLAAVNNYNPELFLARFALAKVARYAAICNKDRSQSRFLLGWLNRSLETA